MRSARDTERAGPTDCEDDHTGKQGSVESDEIRLAKRNRWILAKNGEVSGRLLRREFTRSRTRGISGTANVRCEGGEARPFIRQSICWALLCAEGCKDRGYILCVEGNIAGLQERPEFICHD